MSQLSLDRRSPVRKQKVGKKSSKLCNSTSHGIRVFAILPEWNVEFFEYRKGNEGVGWNEAYSLPIRRHIDGEEGANIAELDSMEIQGYYNQRVSYERNETKIGPDNWSRYWFLRYLDEPSTTTTRLQGLQLFEAFVKNPNYSKYPPKHVVLEDITEAAQEWSLDCILRDIDVFNVASTMFEPDDFSYTFHSTFPSHANCVFGGPIYPREAIRRLGYPDINPLSNERGAYANGFVPPNNQERDEIKKNDEESTNSDEDDPDPKPSKKRRTTRHNT